MIKVIIIDDEVTAITTLAAIFKEFFKDVEVIGTAESGKDGLKLLKTIKPHVVFLDINMPGINGLEMLEMLEERAFKVIITSAHEKYALKAIKNKVYDYLLKPISIDELEKAIANVKAELKEEKSNSGLIKVNAKRGTVFIKSEDICFIKADGRYSELNCINGEKHIVSKNIGEFEEELGKLNFFRVHKTYLVNCAHVKTIGKDESTTIKLSNGTSIEVSRRKKAEFVAFMNKT